MSEPEPESPPSEPAASEPPSAAPRLLVAARIVVPLALALVGYSVLIAQRWSVDHELQLVAPEVADPAAIPVRSYLFGGVSGVDEAGELVDLPVEVELVCGGETVARAALAPSALHTSSATLSAPDARGACRLRGAARDGGDVVATLERPIELSPDAPPQPLSGRLASELQHLRQSPVVLDVADAIAPRIEVRVSTGTCVPEHPCELVVEAPDVDAFSLEETASATLVGAARHDRVHLLSVVAHGPEAHVVLVASRGGTRVAHMDLQLPVALATPWVRAPRVAGGALALELQPPPGREAMIVDTFARGRWARTEVVGAGEVPVEVAGSGLTRLQVRADPFGGDYVGTFHVLDTEPSAERVRELLAAEGIELTDPPGTDWRLLLASAEEEHRQLPAATSGLEADRARLAARQRTVQIVGAIALGLGIVVFLLSLLRRGLRAAQEARDVMTEAGDETATSRATRVRMTIAVIAFVGAVAVAFLAGAALVLARAALVP